MAAHACFVSQCGQLYVYTLEALQVVLDKFSIPLDSSAIGDKYTEQNGFRKLIVGDNMPGSFYEGFTAQQWATYAKKKSSIASQVCRENGKLKASLNSTPPLKLSSVDRDMNDQVFDCDPWASAVPSPRGCASALDDLWLNWKITICTEKDEVEHNIEADPSFTNEHKADNANGDFTVGGAGNIDDIVSQSARSDTEMKENTDQLVVTKTWHEFVEREWPDENCMLNAGSHLSRYGFSASFPSSVIDDIRAAGLSIDHDVNRLRSAFEHAVSDPAFLGAWREQTWDCELRCHRSHRFPCEKCSCSRCSTQKKSNE